MNEGIETIVLLHGLGVTRHAMFALALRLRGQGFRVENWGYSSMRQSTAAHARALHGLLTELDEDPGVSRIHLVGHSMGSIVSRVALGMGPPTKFGRFVMLAPPNRGSHWAAVLGRWLGWLCRPLAELSAQPDSYVNQLPLLEDIDFGVIAARIDMLVPLANTHLDGECGHIVMMGTHSTLPFQRKIAKQVVQFLRTGRFQRRRAEQEVTKPKARIDARRSAAA